MTLKVESEQPVTMTVALRIPGWCGEDFELEGAVGKECRMETAICMSVVSGKRGFVKASLCDEGKGNAGRQQSSSG